jgi:predicted nucleic acid-binding protein
MSGKRVFLDTNILVYVYSDDDKDKQQKATSVLLRNECIISTQVLNEFCNVCIKKLRFPASVIKHIASEILGFCDCYMGAARPLSWLWSYRNVTDFLITIV